VDPAKEVLLDPVLVNPFFYPRGKRAIPVPTALFEVSGGVAPSTCEKNARYEMTRERRRSLAECKKVIARNWQIAITVRTSSAPMPDRSLRPILTSSILLIRIKSAACKAWLVRAARRETDSHEIWQDDEGDHVAVDRFPSPNKGVQSREEGPSERLASQIEGQFFGTLPGGRS
jgi:hypothetical protein